MSSAGLPDEGGSGESGATDPGGTGQGATGPSGSGESGATGPGGAGRGATGPGAAGQGLSAAAPDPAGINTRALSIGIAVGAYAISFGAVSIAAGLDVLQAQALSALMFTGASQFAFVGVIAAGGGMAVAVLTAWLLGLRNGLYALHLGTMLAARDRSSERLTGWRRLGAAHFTIDETTAMVMTYEPDRDAARRAFWATGWSVFLLWNLGTLLGALGAASLSDPKVLGLDAAIPAGFLALLWPRLVDHRTWALAVVSGVAALVLAPVLRPGVPVLAGAGLAVAGALWFTREDAGTGPASARSG